MQDQNIAVKIEHLSKVYKMFDSPQQRVQYLLFHKKVGKDFKALDNVSVEIKKGESFGIIGRNGSGKSTLLQILADIIKPTSGTIKVNGKIAALLELGSGFDPESTGYENIYMNAAILGLTKQEIESKVEDIISFADIGDHLYQPVKTYSSGMFIRLGFAVAINVDAEVLLVDEALAVGDVFFRQKCYQKLNELKKSGVTIILVTHNMGEVEQFCDRALLLDMSKEVQIGSSTEVVKNYYLLNSGKKKETKKEVAQVEPGVEVKALEFIPEFKNFSIKENVFFDLSKSNEISTGKAHYEKVGLFDIEGRAKRVFEKGDEAFFYSVIKVDQDIDKPNLGVHLRNHMNILVFGKDAVQSEIEVPEEVKANRKIHCLQKIKLDIESGDYTICVGMGSITPEAYENRSEMDQIVLDQNIEHITDIVSVGNFQVIDKKIGAPTKMDFYGTCNLPNTYNIIVEE